MIEWLAGIPDGIVDGLVIGAVVLFVAAVVSRWKRA